MWDGGMQQAQIEILVAKWAYLTADGWKIPGWIHSLAAKIAERDERKLRELI